ncbi:T9SS type A sorting domain-containing protein [Flavobacterium sp. LS1R49]|uniref:T9SS type A sorting domain-containing protein n=1 Tax=Flavobacterium shii TaxID=2987687 RepID=A0A9X2ZIY3_9FLAO|nr:T9SS type A sorting domain-containing protein [Flavobacterium shii]MCV9930270.1 T9SS type A sorting domain-containing protein [Flavobacterium shii]
MKKLYFLFSYLFIFNCYAQNPADRDPSFNTFSLPLGNYFIDNDVIKSGIQRDGKIILLKWKSNSGVNELIRVDNNILDASFNTGTGFKGVASDFKIQPDGKIIVIGSFTSYNQVNANKIIRLNPDGSIDKGFTLAPGVTISRPNIEVQSDGKILVTGIINSREGTVRLNQDGSQDTGFVTSVTFFQNSSKISLQPDGKIVVFGITTNDAGDAYNKIVRLNKNGSLDLDITPKLDVINTLYSFATQPDGKILIAANYKEGNNVYSNRIIRLNNDCTIDSSFKSDKFIAYRDLGMSKIIVQPDGKIITSGNVSYEKYIQRNITRLNSDGTQDTTFKIGNAADDIVQNIELLSNGKIIVSGNFKQFNNLSVNKILILNSDGSKDSSFSNRCVGFDSGIVNAVTVLADDKIMVSGSFYGYNGIANSGLIRLNGDGSQDESLTFGGLKGFNDQYNYNNINSIAVQTDGKTVLGGNFTDFNNITTNRIVRINYDGSRDSSFVVGSGFDYEVHKVVVLSDKKTLVGGAFTKYKGISCAGLIRLNSDGTLDESFKSSWIGNNDGQLFLYDIFNLSDGKILISGNFKNNISIIRLNSDGTKDNSFVLTTQAEVNLQKIIIQRDGKIMASGSIGNKPTILRLNPDGSLDNSFNYISPGSGFGISISGIQLDDKLLISAYNGYDNKDKFFIRLNTNGSLDSTFYNIFNNNEIDDDAKIITQSDGKLIYYGSFNSYKGVPAGRLIRLLGQDYKFVQGNNKLDSNNNGCDLNDVAFANLKMNISSAQSTKSFITNTTGNYTITLLNGAHTITPVFENPSYFNVTPTSLNVDFPSELSPRNGNFCITPNGVRPDLEISILPLTAARPGFDAKYKIVYSNKGNQQLSGTVSFDFMDEIIDVVETNPRFSNQSNSNLKWNFTNLNPLETREILVVLNVNSPMETPPVYGGMLLKYKTEISSSQTDQTPDDNKFYFDQIVVNSFDPNDKTCVEGDFISQTKVGDYVHYIIRFENTGTYPAQNIIVKDIIDTNKYDINTLYPLSGSHLFTTEILDNNKVEFKFENINLPFDDANNDGYLAFKIKTKTSLVSGDSFGGSANIFFDYNNAITTNIPTTTISKTLSVKDFSFEKHYILYPNPVKDILNISTKDDIELSSIQIYNFLGQLIMVVPNATHTKTIDVSSLSSGNYLIKIISNKGNSNTKFIKS